MSVSNLTNKIISSIETTLDTSVCYGTLNEFNRFLNDHPLPCVYIQRLSTGTIDRFSRETADYAIFFCKATEYDKTSYENNVDIDECKGRAFRWNALNKTNHSFGYTVDEISYVWQKFDDIVCAYVMRIKATDYSGYCLDASI